MISRFNFFSAKKNKDDDHEDNMIDNSLSAFTLNGALDDIYHSFRLRFEQGVIFRAEACAKDYVVNIEKSRMDQIFHNFISNSMKFTNSGEVVIGCEIVEDGIKIYVRDTGEGLSDYNKEYINGIINSSIEIKDFGRGFGLSVCNKLATEIGGEIGFESEVNKGCLFWAYLPCETVQVSNENVNKLTFIHATRRNMDNPRILIAEDNDTNFMLLQAILRNAKYTNVERALNGKEAIDMCYKEKFDFVFMDIRMPVIDGVTAVDVIRKFNVSIPIIACTANSSDFDRKIEKDTGFTGAIVKPINKKMVIEVLQRFIY